MKSGFKPGAPYAKVCYGVLFFVIALLIVLIGFWNTLFVAAITLAGVFIGSAESLGKATSNLIDKVYPPHKQKVVYTQEDLEKVRQLAEQRKKAQEAHASEEKKEEA
ncbi:MAG: DUF2273 domain-containing protein [Clostridiales bacterium]|nr:DUF2273 domain-containing protein [Clostridiales bacterium]